MRVTRLARGCPRARSSSTPSKAVLIDAIQGAPEAMYERASAGRSPLSQTVSIPMHRQSRLVPVFRSVPPCLRVPSSPPMRFETCQQMRLGQHMKLAPRMIQSMEILQMPLMAPAGAHRAGAGVERRPGAGRAGAGRRGRGGRGRGDRETAAETAADRNLEQRELVVGENPQRRRRLGAAEQPRGRLPGRVRQRVLLRPQLLARWPASATARWTPWPTSPPAARASPSSS